MVAKPWLEVALMQGAFQRYVVLLYVVGILPLGTAIAGASASEKPPFGLYALS